MKRKLMPGGLLLALIVGGLAVLMARPTRSRSVGGGWQFITNQDGSIGLIRSSGDPSRRVVAHVSTNAANSPRAGVPEK